MSQVVAQPTESISSPYRIRWTRIDCESFQTQGLIETGKYELIEGEIIRKMGQKPLHAITVSRLFAWCLSLFTSDFVQTQATLNIAPEDNPTSEPEPDVFVLNRPAVHFLSNYPASGDLLLVAEVSDTTLAFDLSTKAGLYARAGIVEYWVVDVIGRALTIHREPDAGRYQSVIRYAADEMVSLLARPDVTIRVSTILPPLPLEST